MNTCPEQIVHYMHAYLDGDINRDEERQLNEHLDTCSACSELMAELNQTVNFLNFAKPVQAPEGFVDGVMSRLPKEKSQVGIRRWIRSHPFLAAAAMFLVLMSASVFSSYGNDEQFTVSKQPNLIVEGETVVVPEGEVVKGDVIVKNGQLRVEGEVDGDVIVIHGSKYMASTAVVTGKSEEIDKVFDWLWYKIKQTVKEVIPTSSKNDEPDEP